MKVQGQMNKSKGYGRAGLMLDSEDNARQNIERWVEMACCDVVQAKNCQRYIELAVEKSPKLILLDMSLPHTEGFEAAKQISSQRETSDIPIVAMAALGSEFNWREKARRTGCVECVSKPLDFETVSDLVDRYIPKE